MAKTKVTELGTDMEQWDDSVFDVDVAELNAEVNTSNILYLSKQDKKVQLRIIWQNTVDKKYFQMFESDFQGKKVTQVCFKAVQIVGDVMTPVMVVGKPTHVKEINRIIQAVKEDNGIHTLSPYSGIVLTFSKEGTGIQTKYYVNPTLKQVDVLEHYKNGFDTSLAEFVEKMTKPKEEPVNNFDIDEKELFDD